MKKFGKCLIVFMLLISAIIPRAVFADKEISVTIDGRFIEFDVPPQLINDRTMVPLRAIFEALGARVEWDNDTQTVTATKDNISVITTIGSRTMYVNNSRKSMDVAPVIINSRTLVPARFVAEAFDCDVDWNGDLQIVDITTYYVDDNKVYDETLFDEETTKDSNSPRHAPNMYVDWITTNKYDVISVDWYCDEDAYNTYWAVHNWNNGYAGFQNKDGNHVLLLSLWDLDDGTNPTIEYVLDGQNGNFGGEGTGKQVFTNYDWQVGKWYSMCIQVNSDNNKSYYTQYIKEENGNWLKTAVISYPITGNKFHGSSMFQEDFTFNNLMRSCRLRNGCGRIYGTDDWESWNKCKISNSFFPTDDATWENGVQNNIDFNCDWENYSNYVWVQSGGEGFESNGKQIPVEYNLNNSPIPPRNLFENKKEPDKVDEPITSNQAITDGTYVIATKLNQNYALDIDGVGKSNGDNLQLWERNNTPAQSFKVMHLGDGYYRIVNTNSGKAIDAEWGGTESGTNVWQYDINDTPAQIWKIVSAGNNSYYIINKESGLYLDVDNAYADSGTNVKLFDRNDTYDAQRWCFIKQ